MDLQLLLNNLRIVHGQLLKLLQAASDHLSGLRGARVVSVKSLHRREVSVGPAADAVAWLKEKWAAVKDHKYFLAPTPRSFRVAFFCALKAVLSASNRAFSVVRCL